MLGAFDGLAVGCLEGDELGTPDGLPVGALVGEADGISETLGW
jgi:hypothetical protein